MLPRLRWPLLLPLLVGSAACLPGSTAPQVKARGYYLMDFTSGQVLAEVNADQRLEPASLTKLMSAYAKSNPKIVERARVFHEARRLPRLSLVAAEAADEQHEGVGSAIAVGEGKG